MKKKPATPGIKCGVQILRMEDDTYICKYDRVSSRADVKLLLSICDRDVRRRLLMGIPLCPKESAIEEPVAPNTLEV